MHGRRVLWLVPLLLALHNAEEAVFFPRYLAVRARPAPCGLAGGRRPGYFRPGVARTRDRHRRRLGGAVWAERRPGSATALWLLLLLQATVLLNVLWHIAAAVVLFRGYAPGLVTALLLNLPFSLYLLARAVTGAVAGPGRALAAGAGGAPGARAPVVRAAARAER